ncbi:hypothetical protein GCM10023189_59830 [Nibrella saemangeumensis]|uniref:DUF3592 domain-containing protein n=1 Tax=Nibrella saemangeumensis TaxID=1084526 RepID=A0ABP8NSJ8_9BACT
MFKRADSILGRILSIFSTLMMLLVVAVATYLMWFYYQDRHQLQRFENEGKVVQIKVDEVEWGREDTWLDKLGNSVYIHFRYQGKPYTSRWVFDTNWVTRGDRIPMMYHAGFDAFRQPVYNAAAHSSHIQSRLIRWSGIPFYQKDNVTLGGLGILVTALVLLTCSLFFQLTGWELWQWIGRFVAFGLLIVGTIYFSYDSWQYFRYYQQIKQNGRETTVVVEALDRSRIGRGSRRRSRTFDGGFYHYRATVQDGGKKRVIPIEKDDYETLKPGDRLTVLYDTGTDDMMPKTYGPDYWQFVTPVFFLVVALGFVWVMMRPDRKQVLKRYKL